MDKTIIRSIISGFLKNMDFRFTSTNWSSEEIIASREKAWYDHEDIDFSYGQLGFKLPDYVENQLKQIDTMVEFALNQCQQVAAVDNQQNKRFKYV